MKAPRTNVSGIPTNSVGWAVSGSQKPESRLEEVRQDAEQDGAGMSSLRAKASKFLTGFAQTDLKAAFLQGLAFGNGRRFL